MSGGRDAPPCWVERYIARREAARAFLAEAGHRAQLAHSSDTCPAIPAFRVAGYQGCLFYNEDLIALAVHLGWNPPHEMAFRGDPRGKG